jgi:hypothetical protein
MDDDKHETIIKSLETKAEIMGYGVLVIEFKIHGGKLSAGEVIEKREKLG